MPQKITVNHLYKEHENEDCMTMLYVTRYLHYQGVDLLPEKITERLFPPNTVLPTIETPHGTFRGLTAITYFLEQQTGLTDIVNKSHTFVRENPEYRCRR